MNKISQDPKGNRLISSFKESPIFSIESSGKNTSEISTKTRNRSPRFGRMRIRSNSENLYDDNEKVLEAKLKYNVEDISIIGIRQCSDLSRSTLNRLMWALFVCSGLSLAIYQIEERINYYFSYPTSTQLNIVPSEKIAFPQVTVCSNNYIKAKAAEDLGLTEYFKQFLPPYSNETYNKSSLKIKIPDVNETELIERRKTLSPGIEDIKKCTWNGDPCPDDLIGTNFTNVGQCLVFNSNQKYYVNRLGQKVGLMLYLKGNQDDYFIQEIASDGYSVMIHDHNEPARVMELGFRVSLGQRYGIAMTATNTTRLKAPYGKCSDKPGYHPVKCQRKCVTKEIVKNCGCRPIYLDALQNETICDYFDENECAENIYSSYNIKSSKYKNSCICPPLCEEINYQSFVTSSKISKNFMKAQYDYYEDILEDYVIIRIYFKNIEFIEIHTVESYSSMALLSDIGGALGLLLGSTLLTIVEVLEMIVDSIAYVCAKKKYLQNVRILNRCFVRLKSQS